MALFTGEIVDEVSVEQIYQWMQHHNNLLLLDVRNPEEYETWKFEGRHTPETVHMFYGEFVEDEEAAVAKVPRGKEVIVLCAKGGASEYVADMLREVFDIPAVNIAGGMIAWGNYYLRRSIIETPTYQIYQIDRPARGCLSYILVSEGKAAIIDPLRHTQEYQDFLGENGLELALLLDTHAHADHISGGPELARQTGAPYYLHPYDGIHPFDMLPARLDYEMLKDGLEFTLGDLTIQAIHVPGHTLGLVNFLVTGGDGQSFLFTGDSIFIKSFGRPDLGGQGQTWAPLVYNSIFEVIKSRVSPEAWVLPGHYARHDEANEDGTFMKRLGDLWRENEDLQVGKQEFIEFVLNHLPNMPQQYIQIKRVNAGLAQPGEAEASELELGKNVCALSTAY